MVIDDRFGLHQESLTNAAKYANPARVSISVRRSAGSVEIEIVNPILVEAKATILSSGLDLIGMDERASILGGTLVAGPTGHGEYRVLATLPLTIAHMDNPETGLLQPFCNPTLWYGVVLLAIGWGHGRMKPVRQTAQRYKAAFAGTQSV